MTLRLSPVFTCLMVGIAVLCIRTPLNAQDFGQDSASVKAQVANLELPDAPEPQQAQTPAATSPTATPSATATPDGGQQSGAASSASSAAGTASSSGQSANPDTAKGATGGKTQHEIAEEQLKQEKTQRIGILPNFNASYIDDAVPLTPAQKFRLMFSTEKDPATIGFSMFVALIGQADGSHEGYGGGIGGYGERFGQNYADTFDGAFWGNAVLPSLWHQDPRYFRLGKGPAMHRILYALSTNVRAKHDGTGKWEPNYSNLVGNLISGGISNIYLPAKERGVGSTFEGAFVVTAEGGIGSMLEEFWPDFIHYLQRRKQQKQAAGLAWDAKP
ncbi:hypothetical protein [Acidicapsa acidisoli]|uniref:hypothetical protein n=1 Tax=Acidicapsa acidisoli TaxID=1615681 RepID=UPI0021DF5368|nr:hypothetical protein [Acidicapsa acidisoli]